MQKPKIMRSRTLERAASIIAAIIFLQTLFYKFTAAPESVYIFSQLGLEPFGRVGLGVVELIIALLLIWPRTSLIGAILGLGVISGAIFSHLFVLGIEVQDDGGTLFALAVAVFVLCAISLFLQKDKLLSFLTRKTPGSALV